MYHLTQSYAVINSYKYIYLTCKSPWNKMLSMEITILFAIAFNWQGKYSWSLITDNAQDTSKIVHSNKNLGV